MENLLILGEGILWYCWHISHVYMDLLITKDLLFKFICLLNPLICFDRISEWKLSNMVQDV